MSLKTEYYIIKDKKIVVAKDVHEWAMFFEKTKNRRVANNILLDGTTVSTVFIGIDHGFFHDDLPVLFETMVFPWPPGIADIFSKEPNNEHEMCRYYIWEEAEKGHKEILKRYRIRDPRKILVYFFYPFIPILAVRLYYRFLHMIFNVKKFYRRKRTTLGPFIKRKVSVGVGKMKDLVR